MTDWEAYEAGADADDAVGFAGDVAKLGIGLVIGAAVLLFLAGVAFGVVI
jgi:hypothetical protein